MSIFLTEIYNWYKKNRRNLPWRETNDPYKIWLSEIILQQTRVEQGVGYYYRFIEKFPTIKKLASANENEVLKLWQGLGYYSRARNLHYSAKFIQKEFKGIFPDDYNDIIRLKGIGPYSGAAIASIAFQLPYPAVDGNIYRLITRYYGIKTPVDSSKGKNEVYSVAKELIPDNQPGIHNQALMEFGALQCTAKSPNCNSCPLYLSCYARINNMTQLLPLKSKKTKQTIRYFNYFYFDHNEFTYLEKRTKNDIWRNLYQFPLLESEKELSEYEYGRLDFLREIIPYPIIAKIFQQKKHILSHQTIYAKLIYVEVKNEFKIRPTFIRINKKDIFTFAVPKLLEHFILDLGVGN